jgi:GTP-binding protein
MIINKAEFIKSSAQPSECPTTKLSELAFIGRSNVGKSSLINLLTGRKNLAKTSVSPGKTRLINHFLIDEQWFLVGLPGYGYAKVSKKDRSKFTKLIEDYITERENLKCLFVLIDCRHKPQKSDMDFIRWLGVNQVPFIIVFTKTDKPTQKELHANIEAFKEEMLETWEQVPEYFLSSSVKKSGRDEILKFIAGILN